MNCWKGQCTYQEEPINEFFICKREDQISICDAKGTVPFDKCKYGYVGCKLCYRYIQCTEE